MKTIVKASDTFVFGYCIKCFNDCSRQCGDRGKGTTC